MALVINGEVFIFITTAMNQNPELNSSDVINNQLIASKWIQKIRIARILTNDFGMAVRLYLTNLGLAVSSSIAEQIPFEFQNNKQKISVVQLKSFGGSSLTIAVDKKEYFKVRGMHLNCERLIFFKYNSNLLLPTIFKSQINV